MKSKTIAYLFSTIAVFVLLLFVFLGIVSKQKTFNILMTCNNKIITPVNNFKVSKDLNCQIICAVPSKKYDVFKMVNIDTDSPEIVINGETKKMTKVSENDGYLILQQIQNSDYIGNIILDKKLGLVSFSETYNMINSSVGPVSENKFSGYRGFCK